MVSLSGGKMLQSIHEFVLIMQWFHIGRKNVVMKVAHKELLGENIVTRTLET